MCQQLISDCGVGPYYWSAESSTGEIDFLAQDQGAVYAMEVKAEENLRAKKLARVQAGESAGESRALLALALPPARLDAQRPALRRREQGAVGLAERCALRAKRAAK